MSSAVLDRPRWLEALRDEYPFEPRRHALRSGGASLHFVDEGPRDARETLLFVHGNPTWSFLWRAAIRRFARSRRCVAIDHVGMGLSDKPQSYPYTLERHAENLGELVWALDLRRATLVVHDWGGPIGLCALLRARERFDRIVITNTAAFAGFAAPWRIRACRAPLVGALAVRGLNAFARAATTMAVERRLSSQARAGLLAPYSSWRSRVAIQRFVEDIPLSPRDRSWPALVEIERGLASLGDVPALILWGERDFCFTPAFRAEWQRRLPRARVARFENAGHYLLEDAGDAALAALELFLDDRSA